MHHSSNAKTNKCKSHANAKGSKCKSQQMCKLEYAGIRMLQLQRPRIQVSRNSGFLLPRGEGLLSSLASVQRTNSLSFARLPLLECSREHTAHDWPDNYISGRSGHQAAGLFPSLTPLGFRLPQYIGEYVDFPTRWKDGHDRIRRWLLIGPDPVTVDTQFSS